MLNEFIQYLLGGEKFLETEHGEVLNDNEIYLKNDRRKQLVNPEEG
jgi:hypothetical protein